jgi:hypothetical protein
VDKDWVTSEAGVVRSRVKVEESGGVMNRNDMDFFTNESVHDSIGALDYFSHGGVIDLRNDTPGLGQRRQTFN